MAQEAVGGSKVIVSFRTSTGRVQSLACSLEQIQQFSMLYRNRECVEFIKAHMAEVWREATAALEQDWAARRKPDEHHTFAEATAARQPGAAETSAANNRE